MFVSYKKIKKLNPKIDEEEEIKIGKKGINKNLIDSLNNLIKKKKAIKVRILKNCPQSFEEIKEILEKSGFIVAQNRGRTFIILDKKLISKD